MATLRLLMIDCDTNTLHVDSTNNRVGIGTAAPSAAMHIASRSDNANLACYIYNYNDRQSAIVDGFVNVKTRHYRRRAGAYDTGSLDRAGTSCCGTHNRSTYNTATHRFYVQRLVTLHNAVLERMRINSIGDIGIGTSSITNTSGYRNIHIDSLTSGMIMTDVR